MLTHIVYTAKEKIERYKRKSDTISDNDQEMKKMVRLYLKTNGLTCIVEKQWSNASPDRYLLIEEREKSVS